MKKTILLVVLLIFTCVVLGIFAFDVVNRYFNPERQVINYEPISGPITNPLMGLAPWANTDKGTQPHTLVYADLTWRDFEPQEGKFDFKKFEEDNKIDYWRQKGVRIVFRFVIDHPSEIEHMDIPDWLFDAIHEDGDFYQNNYGKGFSPNYSNPIFISYHQKAIQALGQKYGNDALFAFIELGSLGHWGEWHVNSEAGIRPLPFENIRDLYVMHYINAFPNTYLLMRRPFAIASRLNLGLYNDVAGDPEGTREWLDWISSGGEYNVTGEQNALVAMPDAWKRAPIGGEQATSFNDTELYIDSLDRTIQLLQESHATFIGPGGPYNIKGDLLQKGVNQVMSVIGYRLYVSQIIVPQEIYFGDHIDGSLQMGNAGIAPMYYNWPVQLVLLGSKDEIINSYPVNINLNEILPGEFKDYPFSIPISQLKNGTYKVGIEIIDPMLNKPAVRFAMTNSRKDLIQELGEIKINRIINW